jgi:hypothetical protein
MPRPITLLPIPRFGDDIKQLREELLEKSPLAEWEETFARLAAVPPPPPSYEPPPLVRPPGATDAVWKAMLRIDKDYGRGVRPPLMISKLALAIGASENVTWRALKALKLTRAKESARS